MTWPTAVQDALAAEAVAAVAELDRLELAGAGAGRHDGPPGGAGLELDLDLDRRVAAGVEDLAALDVVDAAHVAGPRVRVVVACGCCGQCGERYR